MQNKGTIRLFAIAFALVCLYQLSFTWVATRVENKAEKLSNGDYQIKQAYLDSIAGENVYNLLGIIKYTYRECTERQINLGLDLRGGMNVVLEISVVDVIKALSNYNNDTVFVKAIHLAQEMQKNSQDDFTTLFGKAFEKVNPNGKLAAYFSTVELKDRIKFNSSNAEVLSVIRKETDDAIQNSFNILRNRIDKFGVVQPNIQQLETKGRILVELPGVKDRDRVRKLLKGAANLEFWETYENPELAQFLFQANKVIKDFEATNGDSTAISTETKTDSTASSEVKTDTSKNELALLNKIQGDTTRKDSAALAGQMLKDFPLYTVFQPYVDQKNNSVLPGPVLGYANAKDTAKVNRYLSLKPVRQLFPRNIKFLWSLKPLKEDKSQSFFELYAIKVTRRDGKAPLDGSVITRASSEFGQNNAEATVSMSMSPEGAKTWAHLTKENINKFIAIVIDNSVTSAPRVNTEITGGNSQIEGNFTINEANDLAIVLKSGKMKAQVTIVQEAIVGPSLGEASINAGLTSFVIAIIVVLFYLIFYYGRGGVVADLALLLNTFFTFGVLASLGAVLTLPGIAGIVLSFGMSVDANVITYERIREELRAGKGLKAAITDGFGNALSAIVDGNVTVILTGIVLFIFGTGPIQGFATTLIIGVIISMFTAVLFSRLLFEGMLARNQKITFSNKITANVLVKANFDFIGKRKFFYILSGIIIGIGIVSMVVRGFNLGIDFTGGRTYIVKFDKPVNTVDVQKSLTIACDGVLPEVKTFGSDNQVKIATKFMNDAANKGRSDVDSIVESRIYNGLQPFLEGKSYNAYKEENFRGSEKVGPTIADDIRKAAMWAVLISLVIMFIYIFARFKNWQFGLGSVVSLAHDVLVVLGVYSLFWNVLPFSLEIDQSFIAAILTVIGYSINDTVIIFDRIREYTHLYPKRERHDLYNSAINSTLGRTINTSLITLFTVIVIFIFGGEVIRGFVFALMIGVAIGTYSSIFNAAAIVYDALTMKDKKLKKQ